MNIDSFLYKNSSIPTDLQAVDTLLLRRTTTHHAELIPIISSYLIAAGGKRLRPILTLLTAQLCGYTGTAHIQLAAAIECLHTATLLHDDVVDDSHLRRNIPTANDVWGNKASILVGDFLLSQALQIMVGYGSLHALDVLSNASAVIAEGEVMQLTATHDLSLSHERYFHIIKAKTAALFAAACQLGGIVANVPKEQENVLYQFGLYLGTAFQIADDVLDYSATQEALGKTIGDDFREGKVTLPVILAYQQATPTEKEFWQRTIGEHQQHDSDLATAIATMQSHHILEEAMQEAVTIVKQANAALSLFPAHDIKNILEQIVAFAVNRPY